MLPINSKSFLHPSSWAELRSALDLLVNCTVPGNLVQSSLHRFKLRQQVGCQIVHHLVQRWAEPFVQRRAHACLTQTHTHTLTLLYTLLQYCSNSPRFSPLTAGLLNINTALLEGSRTKSAQVHRFCCDLAGPSLLVFKHCFHPLQGQPPQYHHCRSKPSSITILIFIFYAD